MSKGRDLSALCLSSDGIGHASTKASAAREMAGEACGVSGVAVVAREGQLTSPYSKVCSH